MTIGEQTWMAENLNYQTAEGSYCYMFSTSNCAKYGRLYTYAAAKAACPDGWHLPSKTEFEKLITNVDADLNGSYNETNKAGTALKSTSGWNGSGNGTNASGFSALPAGNRRDNGDFDNSGNYAYFSSATALQSNASYNYYMDLGFNKNNARLGSVNKTRGLSVRCIQNDPQ